ncbi:hypothetical protein [Rubrivivax gelatinosus]|uniref:hypothetical protein n=1 Tax=Rubrivivax gelatinosus TaxID=28068 RepID=UPI00190459DB|nr:hypothetical protein [Rubrivivax gelatinosus]
MDSGRKPAINTTPPISADTPKALREETQETKKNMPAGVIKASRDTAIRLRHDGKPLSAKDNFPASAENHPAG